MQTEAPPVLSYTFAWDRAEFARFYRQLARHARLGLVANLCLWGFVAMTAFNAVYTVYVAATRGVAAAAEMLPWVLMMVLYVAFFRLFAPTWTARKWERRNCCSAHPTTREMDDEGLRIHCSMRDLKLAWPGIRRVVETREFLIFFQTERCAHYLPKRAVGGAAELQRLRDFLIRHTPVQQAKGVA